MRNHWVVLDVETTIPESNTVSGPGGKNNPYGTCRCVYLGLQPKGQPDVTVVDDNFHEALFQAMESEDPGAVVLIGHNISFDLHHLLKDVGIDKLPGEVTIWDTMTAEYYLQSQDAEARSIKLQTLFSKYEWETPKDDVVGELFRQGVGSDQIDRAVLEPYLVNDVEGTRHVALRQMQRARELHLLPLMRDQMDAQLLFMVMEHTGMWVNAQAVDELVTQKAGERTRLVAELESLVTTRLVGMCPSRTVLGDRQTKVAICGGEYLYKGRREEGLLKSGKPKMRVYKEQRRIAPLEGFRGQAPESFSEFDIGLLLPQCRPPASTYLQLILDFRAVRKELTTSIDGALRRADQRGILRTGYNQCITPTGRVSSSNPCLQNLPKE